jgi:hypothetical protein
VIHQLPDPLFRHFVIRTPHVDLAGDMAALIESVDMIIEQIEAVPGPRKSGREACQPLSNEYVPVRASFAQRGPMVCFPSLAATNSDQPKRALQSFTVSKSTTSFYTDWASVPNQKRFRILNADHAASRSSSFFTPSLPMIRRNSAATPSSTHAFHSCVWSRFPDRRTTSMPLSLSCWNGSNSPMAEGDPIRIIPHRGVDDDCGSLEVLFADGRGSVRFYWDNLVSRRLRRKTLTRKQATDKATALAKAEMDKLV